MIGRIDLKAFRLRIGFYSKALIRHHVIRRFFCIDSQKQNDKEEYERKVIKHSVPAGEILALVILYFYQFSCLLQFPASLLEKFGTGERGAGMSASKASLKVI